MLRYSIVVQWSDEDEGYIATTPELPGLSAFGKNQKEAIKEFLVAAKAFIQVLKETGEEIPEPNTLKPFSGQTRLRLPKSLHAALSNKAKQEGISFNTYIVQLLSERNSLRVVRKDIESLKIVIQGRVIASSQTKSQLAETILWDGNELPSVQGNTAFIQ